MISISQASLFPWAPAFSEFQSLIKNAIAVIKSTGVNRTRVLFTFPLSLTSVGHRYPGCWSLLVEHLCIQVLLGAAQWLCLGAGAQDARG